ncbi:hypothetical protein [uncultured Thiohalocapsa sp.]|uniref:hypothetical protein n=1 Tax=uncultured Thiohalocapsa sp. TaxID=768990 RepID=UPI0025FEFA6F|nr:hypothetical protein [uncultured Thiohalocapsa sp.]
MRRILSMAAAGLAALTLISPVPAQDPVVRNFSHVAAERMRLVLDELILRSCFGTGISWGQGATLRLSAGCVLFGVSCVI